MTPREIELVQTTWKGMLPIRDTFAEIFYGKLFSLDGGLQRHFGGDMKEQGRNFAAMMSIFVRNLEEPEMVRSRTPWARRSPTRWRPRGAARGSASPTRCGLS